MNDANGEPIKQAATQVDAEHDEVKLNGERLALVGLRYVMMHKPVDGSVRPAAVSPAGNRHYRLT